VKDLQEEQSKTLRWKREWEHLREQCTALKTQNNSLQVLQEKAHPAVEFREDLMELKATLAIQKEQIRSMTAEWTPPGICWIFV